MWLLPAWGVSVFALILATGVVPGQPTPYPMISGPIVALLASALLLLSAPRFFERGKGTDRTRS